jgi:tetratricopeptide (TPR) repeat protein
MIHPPARAAAPSALAAAAAAAAVAAVVAAVAPAPAAAQPLKAPGVKQDAALAELVLATHLDDDLWRARLGADRVAEPDERADLLYMVGLAHEDKHEDAAALEAYTKALEARPDLAQARFMRGQLLVRLKQPAAAKADLEAFVAHPGVDVFEKGIAARLLMELASKQC